MSLYGDLPQAKNVQKDEQAKQKSDWSQISQLLPSNLKKDPQQNLSSSAHRRPNVLAPPSVLRASRNPIGTKNGSASTSAPTKTLHTPANRAPNIIANSDVSKQSSIESGVKKARVAPVYASFSAVLQEEYIPSKPNNYLEFSRAREWKRIEEANQDRNRKEASLSERLRHLHEKAKEYADKQETLKTLQVSGEEAYMRRARLGTPAVPAQMEEEEDKHADVPQMKKGMSAAEKMMSKMGWKKGEGLGKAKQGIKKPLEAQKTARVGGIIVESDSSKPKKEKQTQGPTCVLLLKNMVGPGEVDDELEDEVANECEEKYGHVVRVTIFEVTDPSIAPEEAVRIFVEFEDVSSSMKAHASLNGRFFGGRKLVAEFFSLERFNENDLLDDQSC